MVHALEEAHRLLTPDGLLVDIHPLPEAPTIEVRQGGKLLLSETYPSQSVEDYRQADRAIESAIERRLFAAPHRDLFEFLTYASSASELNDFFKKTGAYDHSPKDQAVEARKAELFTRVDQLIKSTGAAADVIFVERAQVAVLRPIA